ncbi:UvrD-helicase domain-containing protein, partial [Candidatus Similichlamydia epinepheli]|uniref:UvrD-helicase domain-containing protein n=1 Tax=Candidatus Similichlamydia epinepheli TaxID=1903953 RepID=UPI0013008C9B
MQLNSQQQDVLSHVQGPVLVLAGAGTGKTTVLTERLCRMVRHHHVCPTQILALTFTNQAARIMQFRIRRRGVEGAWIGTFHRLGYDLLRSYLPTTTIQQTDAFSLYDEGDRKKILRDLIETTQSSLSLSCLEQFLKKQKNEGETIRSDNTENEKEHLYYLY